MSSTEPMADLAFMPREIVESGREAQAIYQAKRLLDFLRSRETPIPGGRMRFVLEKRHLRHLGRVHELLDCLVAEHAGGWKRRDQASDDALTLAPGEVDRDVYEVSLEKPPYGPVWARYPLDTYRNPKSRQQVINWLLFFGHDTWRNRLTREPDFLTGEEIDRLWRDLLAAADRFEVEPDRWPAAAEARKRLAGGA